MRNHAYRLVLGSLLLSAHFAAGQTLIWATTGAFSPVVSPPPASIQPVAGKPCARPAEMFDIDEYDGPFHNLVSGFSHKLENKTVVASHSHRHLPPCSLSAGEKFGLFASNSFEPINFLSAGWDAGWAQ